MPQFVNVGVKEKMESPLNRDRIISHSYEILKVIGGLTALGLLWDLYNFCKKRKNKNRLESGTVCLCWVCHVFVMKVVLIIKVFFLVEMAENDHVSVETSSHVALHDNWTIPNDNKTNDK